MWRLVETQIAAVVDRGQAFVGILGIVGAVVTMAAWHQRWDHHFRTHRQRFVHEVFGELSAGLNENPANFMPERERPRKFLWPVAFKNMQISAANSAGDNFDESCLLGNIRPRDCTNYRLSSRTGKCSYANLFHLCVPSQPRY